MSAHTKILMDRCQSFWVKKNWLEKKSPGKNDPKRKALFISLGATRGKKLFDGVLLSVRYFLDAIDMELWQALLYRGFDFEGDILKHPEHLEEAFRVGKEFSRALKKT